MTEEGTRVHVAVEHATMRRLLTDLLVREHGWCVTSDDTGGQQPAEAHLQKADLLIIDETLFSRPGWCQASAQSGAIVLVIAAEDDPSSRQAALARGAHGCLPREQLGERLGTEIARTLGRADTGVVRDHGI